MAKYFFILFVLFLFASDSFSQQVYKNKDYGFSISFPDGWEVKKGDQAEIIVRAVLDSMTEINIVQQINQGVNDSTFAQMGAEFFCQKMAERLGSMLKEYRTVEYKAVKVSGMNTYYINYTCSVNGRQMNSRQYFFVRKGVLYVITAGCADDENEKYRPVFDESVNSMKFY